MSIQNDWNKKKELYGVPLYKFISYCSLRSVKGKIGLKHGLLNRIDSTKQITTNGETKLIDIVEFKSTDLYKQMVSEGTLLIIDEIQSLKNINDQFKACKELIREIVKSCNYFDPPEETVKSRIMLLSGTPFDKQTQIPHFFRLSGIMKKDELSQFNIQTLSNNWTGFNDVYELCLKINKFLTKSIISIPKNTGNNKILLPACYNLFQKIIKQLISHSMHSIKIDSKTDKKNAFYSVLLESDRQLLLEGVKSLKSACCYNENNDNINYGSGINTLRKLQSAMITIETAKISTFVRVARQYLLNNTNCKVVICVNYTQTIKDIECELSEFNPLILNGSTPIRSRGIIIDKFQEQNNKYRLIVSNTAVTSTGINLDDQNGNFPRICLVSPNYCTIQLAQLSDRFRRTLTKSDSVVHFLFGKHCCELKVLHALALKSEIMKQTSIDTIDDGVVFPCDYLTFVENNVESIDNSIIDYLRSKEL